MMAKMSSKYGLSERYTNHSIRVTSLQLLDDENIEGRHIIRISGHKSIDSVQNYARLSAARKRNISSLFSNNLDDASAHQSEDPLPQPSTSHEYQHTVPSTSLSCATMKDSTETSSTATTDVHPEANLVDFNVEASADDETMHEIILSCCAMVIVDV